MADRNREYDQNRWWRDRDYPRNRDFYDRDHYDRNDYDRNYYGRDYYGRNYSERDYYGRDYYDRDIYSDRRFSPYNRGYNPNYDYEYRDYGYDYLDTPYSGWVNGPYTGVGPRNYRRSDERIQDDVNDRLTWHGHVNARDIEVSVDDGVVTLSGTVDSRREKRMAEDAAESVSGVWDVNNNLTIRETERWGRTGTMEQEGKVREGMEVVGKNSDRVGHVKEVRSNDFLVDRPMARDVYVPLSATKIADGRIRLNVQAGEVDNQGWETPEMLETS